MTRKDYKLIASILHECLVFKGQYCRDKYDDAGIWLAVDKFCEALKQDNPGFDKECFLAAVRGGI